MRYAIACINDCGDILVAENAAGSRRVSRRYGQDVQVGAAYAGAVNSEEHVVLSADLWPGHGFNPPLAIAMKNGGLHLHCHSNISCGARAAS